MAGERAHGGSAARAFWAGTGYRSGALVVDQDTGDMGVMHGPVTGGFLIKQVHGERDWIAPMRRLRIANDAERRALGLAPPRTVD
ncbi:hypothetical protein [Streptomyces roseoverticillatus]|uniref:hypothetical protein n=1 Tax=Streptomyces roseoverticillatus TaxID=66429 RepID=UPI0012FF02B4|nr:hypothetical protein [Streptomyces roseoverticillatus]